MSLLLNMLSRLVITFLPRSMRLLIPWLQSPSAVILEPQKINLTLFPLFPHLPLPVLNLSIFLTLANLMRKCYYFKISIFMNIRGVGYISCSYWYLLFLNWLGCSLPNVGSIHWCHSPIENEYVIDINPFS